MNGKRQSMMQHKENQEGAQIYRELTLDCTKSPPDAVTLKMVDNDLHIISYGDGFADGVVAVLAEDGQRQLRHFMIGIHWESGPVQLMLPFDSENRVGDVKE
jgi:hypothetical protein